MFRKLKCIYAVDNLQSLKPIHDQDHLLACSLKDEFFLCFFNKFTELLTPTQKVDSPTEK